MHLCVISFKECWRDAEGRWFSSGGFPIQMEAVTSLFASSTLLVVEVPFQAGGITLPASATVVPLRSPRGVNLRRKASVLRHLGGYLRIMVKHARQTDVVHTPVPGDLALLGMVTALLLRKRLLVRYGGSWELTSESTLVGRLTRGLMRRAAGGRNVMLATGAGILPPAPGIEWIFATALSETEVRTVAADIERQRGRPLRLVYAGRLSSEKGVRYLILGLASARRRQGFQSVPAVLAIAGDGPERAALERLVSEEGCDDLVRFLGQLDRPALLAQLRESDVCVLPSLTESFCKARLDAMLCGAAVLTTPVGFGRELIGADGVRGWIVPPGDGSALAEAIEAIARRDLDWPALRARCRAYAESLTIEKWKERIAELCGRQWRLRRIEGKLCP